MGGWGTRRAGSFSGKAVAAPTHSSIEFAAEGHNLHYRSLGLTDDVEFAAEDGTLEFSAKGQ